MGKIWGICKIVALYSIPLIQYARFISSMKYVGLIIHFNALFASINPLAINDKRWTTYEKFRTIYKIVVYPITLC